LDAADYSGLLERADEALLEAKRAGKNRIPWWATWFSAPIRK
jgi:PleD family two-component response regulator